MSTPTSAATTATATAIRAPKKRRVLTAAICLALSAAGIAAATHLDGTSAWAGRGGDAQGAVASPSTPPAPPPATKRGTTTRSAHPPVAKAPPPAAAENAAPPLTVPDFKGRRLSAAHREGRRLGLRVLARDEYGERVTSNMSSYRIRRQVTRAGEPIEPGAAVEVRVRELGGFAEGY